MTMPMSDKIFVAIHYWCSHWIYVKTTVWHSVIDILSITKYVYNILEESTGEELSFQKMADPFISILVRTEEFFCMEAKSTTETLQKISYSQKRISVTN